MTKKSYMVNISSSDNKKLHQEADMSNIIIESSKKRLTPINCVMGKNDLTHSNNEITAMNIINANNTHQIMSSTTGSMGSGNSTARGGMAASSSSNKTTSKSKCVLDYDARILMPRAILGNEVTRTSLSIREANIRQNRTDDGMLQDDNDDETFIENMMKRYNDQLKKNGGKMPALTAAACLSTKRSKYMAKRKNCFLNEINVNLMKRFRAETAASAAATKANEISPLLDIINNDTAVYHQHHQGQSECNEISIIKKDASTQTKDEISFNVNNDENSTLMIIPAKTPTINLKLVPNELLDRSDSIIIPPTPTMTLRAVPSKSVSKIVQNPNSIGVSIITSYPEQSNNNNTEIDKRTKLLLFSPPCSSIFDPMSKSERAHHSLFPPDDDPSKSQPPTAIIPYHHLFDNNNIIDDGNTTNVPSSPATTVSISKYRDSELFF